MTLRARTPTPSHQLDTTPLHNEATKLLEDLALINDVASLGRVAEAFECYASAARRMRCAAEYKCDDEQLRSGDAMRRARRKLAMARAYLGKVDKT